MSSVAFFSFFCGSFDGCGGVTDGCNCCRISFLISSFLICHFCFFRFSLENSGGNAASTYLYISSCNPYRGGIGAFIFFFAFGIATTGTSSSETSSSSTTFGSTFCSGFGSTSGLFFLSSAFAALA